MVLEESVTARADYALHSLFGMEKTESLKSGYLGSPVVKEITVRT
jgi:hypothetical protein